MLMDSAVKARPGTMRRMLADNSQNCKFLRISARYGREGEPLDVLAEPGLMKPFRIKTIDHQTEQKTEMFIFAKGRTEVFDIATCLGIPYGQSESVVFIEGQPYNATTDMTRHIKLIPSTVEACIRLNEEMTRIINDSFDKKQGADMAGNTADEAVAGLVGDLQ